MLKIGDLTPTATQDGRWTDGNIAGGTSPTIILAGWFNAVQDELVNIVESAGIELDKDNSGQVLEALKKSFLSRSNPFADIKADGSAAIAKALSNLGLGDIAKQSANDVNITGGIIKSTDGKLFDGSNRVYSAANPGATFSSDGFGMWFNVLPAMLQIRIGDWSIGSAAGASVTVTFVQAFTRKCLMVIPVPEISANDQIGILGLTPTQATINKGNSDVSPRQGKYIAFGY